MVFDSPVFFYFFAFVFVLYHALGSSYRAQNVLLLVASFVFYGWWDWRFLGLIVVSAGVDYLVGLKLAGERSRGRWLALSAVTNLGILGTFKYFDFFAESFGEMLAVFGLHFEPVLLKVALPVGISFYTFQSMAYSIDVYRRRIEPERNPLTFMTYVAFFPQLVAGPIERAERLLSQLNRPRRLDPAWIKEAVWLLVWGYFLKVCVADSAARFVSGTFQVGQTSGTLTVLGTIAFGIQIYCDFNAYSLIARGTAMLLGIELSWNFNRPYFAASIQDFWRRWHISLSTWLRDYLYISLGGSRASSARTAFNLMATMVLGGLWHGASWNFVLWGVLHGGALGVHRLWKRFAADVRVPWAIGWASTMFVVFAGWMVFRCQSYELLTSMTASLSNPTWSGAATRMSLSLVALFAAFVPMELWMTRTNSPTPALALSNVPFALLTGLLAFLTWTMFGRYTTTFVYFQF